MRTVVKINENLLKFLSLFCWKRWRTVVLAFVGISRERKTVCLSSQLSGRADSSITHCSLSARCWRPSWFDSRWFALVCAAGRCLPSLPPPPSPPPPFLALLFQTHLRCRDPRRNSAPFSENRTDTRSADLGNSLSVLPRFSALAHSCWSVPYVCVEEPRRSFHGSASWGDEPGLIHSTAVLVVNQSD